MKAICGGRLVMHDRIEEGKAILFEDKIIGIVPESEVPAEAERIEVNGALVTPGLFDVHIHGSGGCDTMDGSEEALRTIASTVVKNGVTRFLATSVTLPLDRTAKVFDLVRTVVGKSGEGWDGAVIEGINMEGPFIHPAYKGAHEENYIADFDFDFMKQYSDVIRVVTVAPDKEGGMEFIRKVTTETPIKVSIGHTAATYEQAMEAIENGATQVTHLYNAMTPMHHRKPGVVTAALRSDVYTEMICDTIHVHPAMFQFVMDCKGKDKFVLITDCMRAGGMPQGEYTLGELKVVVDETSARLMDGTLAGSILTLNKAIDNVHKNYNTAEVLGDDTGVTGVTIRHSDGKERTLAISGFFVAIGHHPNTELFRDQLELDAEGYIRTEGSSSRTSVEGVFAAGDVHPTFSGRDAISFSNKM